jgi:hypothetical protein
MSGCIKLTTLFSMTNPWTNLRVDNPYILDIDKESVAAFSRSVSNDRKLDTESIPEPFIGNPETARVVLLGLNPGHSEEDETAHKRAKFKDVLFRNLRHEPLEYPFYPLNPQFVNTPTAQWWRSHLRELLDRDIDCVTISHKLMVIEWFPYHSKRSGLPVRQVCPSQSYSFDLAMKALEKCFVIRMRSKAHWIQVDPRFGEVHSLHSPQNCCLSSRNLGKENFALLVEAFQT